MKFGLMKPLNRQYSNTDSIIHDHSKASVSKMTVENNLKNLAEKEQSIQVYPRHYKTQNTVAETYGPCIRFNRCRNIGELGNGLCVDCWDGTNSPDTYKHEQDIEEEDIEDME